MLHIVLLSTEWMVQLVGTSFVTTKDTKVHKEKRLRMCPS